MNYPKGWTDLTTSEPKYIMGYYGKTKNRLPEEELCVLREGTDSQELQRDTGRPNSIHAPEVLRSNLHGEGDGAGARNAGGLACSGGEVQREEMPTLRGDGSPSGASSRSEPGEQYTGEPNDLVRFLSLEMALDTWEEESKAAGCLQNMRRACAEIGYVPETLSEIQEVWRSTTDEEKDWLKIRISTRNPWHSEWPGVPRVAKSIPSRVDRLKCLGNSIVPQIAKEIFLQPIFDEWRRP